MTPMPVKPDYEEAVQIDTLARTVWGEARGEGRTGMEAVASVIMNRVARPGWWGKDVTSVCKSKDQFSCWNQDDVNLKKMLGVTGADAPFTVALDVATKAVRRQLPDPTDGADHYFNPNKVLPSWAQHMDYCRRIGNHEFYRSKR